MFKAWRIQTNIFTILMFQSVFSRKPFVLSNLQVLVICDHVKKTSSASAIQTAKLTLPQNTLVESWANTIRCAEPEVMTGGGLAANTEVLVAAPSVAVVKTPSVANALVKAPLAKPSKAAKAVLQRHDSNASCRSMDTDAENLLMEAVMGPLQAEEVT